MEAGKVPGRVEVEACTVGKGKVVHIIIIQYIPTFVRSLELEKMSCVKFVLIPSSHTVLHSCVHIHTFTFSHVSITRYMYCIHPPVNHCCAH